MVIAVQLALMQELGPMCKSLLTHILRMSPDGMPLKSVALFAFLRLWKRVIKQWPMWTQAVDSDDNKFISLQNTGIAEMLLEMISTENVPRMCVLKCLSILCHSLPASDQLIHKKTTPPFAVSLSDKVLQDSTLSALIDFCLTLPSRQQSFAGEKTLFVESYTQIISPVVADIEENCPVEKKLKIQHTLEKYNCSEILTTERNEMKTLKSSDKVANVNSDSRHIQGVVMLVLKSCAHLTCQSKESVSNEGEFLLTF